MEGSLSLAHDTVAKQGMQPLKIAAFLTGGGLLCADPAWAFRPFDSTDAAIAKPGEFEIELGPLGYRHGPGGGALIAPGLVANYGLSDTWEAVLEGRGVHASSGNRLEDAAASLKVILKPGSFQDQAGISLASEFSVLLPGIGGDHGAGLEWSGIASGKTAWGAYHVNLGAELTREGDGAAFAGFILEGPLDWIVRPVAEARYEWTSGLEDEASILVGAIWQPRESLAFDFALRHASVGGKPDDQVRAGLTFSFD
jgi:hypothetical protein